MRPRGATSRAPRSPLANLHTRQPQTPSGVQIDEAMKIHYAERLAAILNAAARPFSSLPQPRARPLTISFRCSAIACASLSASICSSGTTATFSSPKVSHRCENIFAPSYETQRLWSRNVCSRDAEFRHTRTSLRTWCLLKSCKQRNNILLGITSAD